MPAPDSEIARIMIAASSDAEPGAAIFLGDTDAEPAGIRQRPMEVGGEAAFLVLLQPIGIVEARADPCNRVADRFLVGGERKIHGVIPWWNLMRLMLTPSRTRRRDLFGRKAGFLQGYRCRARSDAAPAVSARPAFPTMVADDLHAANRAFARMIDHRKESGRDQMRVLQHAFEVMHRHDRYIGLGEQFGPFGRGSGLEDAREFGIDRIDIGGASGKGCEYRIAAQIVAAGGLKETCPTACRYRRSRRYSRPRSCKAGGRATNAAHSRPCRAAARRSDRPYGRP